MLMFDVTSLTMLILFACRRQRIKQLLSLISSVGSRESKSFILCLLFASIASHLSLLCLLFSGQVILSGDIVKSIRIFLLTLPTNLANFALTYPPYYILVVHLLAQFEQRTLARLTTDVSSNRKALYQLELMIHVRELFDELFNIVPFALFSTLFSTVPSAAVLMMGTPTRRDGKIMMTVYLFGNLVIVLWLLMMMKQVCSMKSKTSRMAHAFVQAMRMQGARKPAMMMQEAVIEAASQLANHNLTGCYLFAINRSLLLSFVSAIITFSVLFCQLAASNTAAQTRA